MQWNRKLKESLAHIINWGHFYQPNFINFLLDKYSVNELTELSKSLHKTTQFDLISSCENFVERHSFRTKKLGKITAFYAVNVD